MGSDVVIYTIGSWHEVASLTGETVNSPLYLFRGQNYHLVSDRFGNGNRAMVHVLHKRIHANAHRTTVRTNVWEVIVHSSSPHIQYSSQFGMYETGR